MVEVGRDRLFAGDEDRRLLAQRWGEGELGGARRDGMLVACWAVWGWLLVGCYERKAPGLER